MDYSGIALGCYKHFSSLEGNDHIAGVYALEKLVEIAHKNDVKTILEVGLGIGSISYTLLSAAEQSGKQVSYFGTEANSFCLSVLPDYLGAKFKEVNLFSSIDDLPETLKADLIIVDGSDAMLAKLPNLAASGAIIFVEGLRAEQVNKLKQLFEHSISVLSISAYKNPSFGPFPATNWAGGGSIIYTKPTMQQRIQCFFEKCKTSLRYRVIRKIRS